MQTTQRELVETTARGWRNGIISMNAPAHGKCRSCGGSIWFGKVQFKGQPKPSWIVYSEAGHGGNGTMVMEKHDCSKEFHRKN